MRRRQFVTFAVAGAALWPFAAAAQQTRRPRLGVLLVGNRELFSRLFGEGLRELGYIDGQNITIELRSADEKLDRLPDLAAELVRLGVDVIIASETPAVQAANAPPPTYRSSWPRRVIRSAPV
jgi:putative ABC transport system substrate-binding protein